MALTLMLALAALAGQDATAAQPAPLAPSGKWLAEFNESLCVLSRAYGTGDQKMQLAFKPAPADESIEVILVMPYKGVPYYRSGKVEMTLGPGGTATKGDYRDYTIEADENTVSERRRLLRAWVKPAELGDVTTAKTLAVVFSKRDQWIFELRGTAKAMKVIDECQDSLVRSWGFDPDVLRKQIARATPISPPAKWITDNDYPRGALAAGMRGTVRLRYRVDKTGVPRECTILQSSGSPLLDKTSCELIGKRARFHPALGADGQPQDGLRSETIQWML